ncbi:MAG: PTS sugar transporter subunit IIA [Planctomycetes bacterium]|nr:PTS sugar transporter subunit IIA [Planctomycetota bacterium]
MQLTVHDAATLLSVSEKTIYRWIKQGRLPAYQINDQYRFNRAELLEWATAKRINVSPEIFAETEGNGQSMPTLSEALQGGGIHYRVGGTDKSSVLACVVDLMHLPEEVDRQYLLKVLLTRESLGSTGIGDGIAIPHVRNPIVMYIPRPTITLCFLENRIDFAAMDGKPVETLFTLISPTIRAHLGLLSKLAFALREDKFKDAVAKRGSRQELLDAVADADRRLAATESPRPDEHVLTSPGMENA